MRRFIAGLLIAATSLCAAPGITLWDKARHGMTESELQQVFGSALHREQKAPNEGATFYVPFTLERSACGSVFTTEFYFWASSKTLANVTLSSHSRLPNFSTINCTIGALSSRYGHPSTFENHPPGVAGRWTTPNGLLVYATTIPAGDLISVEYSAVPKDAF